MDILNFFNYVNYLHQEHMKLKKTYETLLCIVIQELPEIKARMEASEKRISKRFQRRPSTLKTDWFASFVEKTLMSNGN